MITAVFLEKRKSKFGETTETYSISWKRKRKRLISKGKKVLMLF